jgi:hypothetical protein
MKKIFMDAFYSQFNEFLDQLKAMYPDDPDFPNFASNLNMMKMMNPLYPVTFIKTDIIDKFGEKILARDESFFLTNTDIQQSADIDIVYKLKGYISEMTPENKEAVWSYLEILTKLTLKIVAL